MQKKSFFLTKFSSRLSIIGKDGIYGMIRKETDPLIFENSQTVGNAKSFAKEVETKVAKNFPYQRQVLQKRQENLKEEAKSRRNKNVSGNLSTRSSLQPNLPTIFKNNDLASKSNTNKPITRTKTQEVVEVKSKLPNSIISQLSLNRLANSGKQLMKTTENLSQTVTSSISENKGRPKLLSSMHIIPEKEEFVVKRRYADYQPKTLEDYKKIAQVEPKRGGLGPEIGGNKWNKRKEKVDRLSEYCKQVSSRIRVVEKIPGPVVVEERKKEEQVESSKMYKRKIYTEELEKKRWGSVKEGNQLVVRGGGSSMELSHFDVAELKKSLLL